MDFAIFQQPLRFLYHSIEVFALENIVHMKAIRLHVLHEILGAVSVIANFQREYLVFLHQIREPSITIVVIYEVVSFPDFVIASPKIHQ